MSIRSKFMLGASATALLLAAHVPLVLADTPPTAQAGEGELGEVVVTARRTSENIQDIPLAITAVSTETLIEDHAVGLEDVANLTPGLKFTSFLDSVNGNVTIRGLQQENVQSPIGNVGVFLDGIYLQRGFMVDTNLGDFDRIEVVKGPQSALYGANTFAGALNYVLKQPTDEFRMDGTVTEGNGNLNEAKIGVGGPIIKGILDGRLYAAQSDFNGVVPNSFPGATGTDQYFGGHKFQNYSGGLKFTPTDALTVNASFSYAKRFYQIQPYYTIDGDSAEDHMNCGQPANNSIPGQLSLWCGSLPTSTSAFRTAASTAPPGLSFLPQPGTTSVNEVGKAAASYKFSDALTLNYTFGHAYGNSLEQANFSTDPTAVNPFFPFLAAQREGGELTYQSHEVRVVYDGPGAFTGEVGYLYSRADDQEAFGLLFTAADQPYLSLTSNPLSLAGVPVPFFAYNEHYTTNSPFGKVKYSFLDAKADFTAELRYTSTRLSYQDVLGQFDATHPTPPAMPTTPPPPLNATYNNVTPRFTLNYHVTPEELAYVSAARGVKDGGFNGYESSTTTLLPNQRTYGEETNWTYELGLKGTYLDRTLLVDADFFYVNWQNRVEAVVPSNFNAPTVNSQSAGVVPTIYENVGNAISYGIEVGAKWRPTSNWDIAEALSVQNPRFSGTSLAPSFNAVCTPALCKYNGSYFTGEIPSVSGNELPLVSQVTNDLEVNYLGRIDDWTYRIGVNEIYRGMQYVDDINLTKIAAFWLTDAHATFGKDAFKVTLWTKNLFNREYVSSSFSIPSIYQYNANLGELRTFGVTLAVNF